MVSAYNSLLTSYILGSNAEPLVDSLADVAANSKVNLVVDKGLAVDVVVSVRQIKKISHYENSVQLFYSNIRVLLLGSTNSLAIN